MDELKIVWISLAVKQRDLIFKYWKDRNKSNLYSKKLNIKFKEQIHILIENPKLGKKINYKDFRAIILNQYSIIYLHRKNKIIIMSVWDNRQNPNKLLKILKDNRE